MAFITSFSHMPHDNNWTVSMTTEQTPSCWWMPWDEGVRSGELPVSGSCLLRISCQNVTYRFPYYIFSMYAPHTDGWQIKGKTWMPDRWLCYAVGNILLAWFGFTCPLRAKGHCKSIQSCCEWSPLSDDETFIQMRVVFSRMTNFQHIF